MTTTETGVLRPSSQLVLVLFLGVFMAALDTAIVGPALPAMQATFGVGTAPLALVTILYTLGVLGATTPLARLSDQRGRRTVYLGCVAGFALSSLLIAVAPSFWMLLVGRLLQGICAGGVTPTASAVVADAFAPAERGKLLGLLGATFGMAFVLGPPVAGGLTALVSWQAIFVLNLPIAAVVLVLGAATLPHRPAAQVQAPMDGLGILVLVGTLVALVLGLTRVADPLLGFTVWPWALAIAAGGVVVFVVVEQRVDAPLIPPALVAQRQLAITYVLTIAAGFGMGALVFLSSLAVARHGVAPSQAGLVLIPLVLCAMVGSAGSGRVLHQRGARWLLARGFAALALGYGLIGLVDAGLWGFIATTLPAGLGVGIVVGGALRTLAIDAAPVQLRGTAQGLVNMATSIGVLLAAAVIATIAQVRGSFADAYVFVAVLLAIAFVATRSLHPLMRDTPVLV